MKRPLTQSMISTFRNCRRKYYYTYILCLKSKEFHIPFAVGSALHFGIPGSLFISKDVKKAVKAGLDHMNERKKKFEKMTSFSGEEDQGFIYQCTCVESVIVNYAKFYKTFIHDLKVLSTEKIIEHKKLILPGGFVLTGKTDAVLKYNNTVFLYELKTSKNLQYDRLLMYYPQVLTYFLITATEKRNVPTEIYLDAVQKPQIRIKKDESKEEFIYRLDEYYTSSQSFQHERWIPRTRNLNQMHIIVRETAKEIVEAEDKDNFYCNRFSCRVFGVCKFIDFCDYGINDLNMIKFTKKTSVNEELEKGDGNG